MKLTMTMVAAACLLTAAGCSSSSTDAEDNPAPTTSTSAVATAASCSPTQAIDDPAFAAAVAAVPLPSGATLLGGRISTDSDSPGMITTAVNICAPTITTADEIRPLATEYAKALKASPLTEQIIAVYVGSYQVDGPSVVNEVKVKDGSFQANLWNGKPSATAEQARWEVIAE